MASEEIGESGAKSTRIRKQVIAKLVAQAQAERWKLADLLEAVAVHHYWQGYRSSRMREIRGKRGRAA
jgi:hypothetical protein